MRLKQEGLSQSPGQAMFDFMDFSNRIGFNDVWEFEKRWAK